MASRKTFQPYIHLNIPRTFQSSADLIHPHLYDHFKLPPCLFWHTAANPAVSKRIRTGVQSAGREHSGASSKQRYYLLTRIRTVFIAAICLVLFFGFQCFNTGLFVMPIIHDVNYAQYKCFDIIKHSVSENIAESIRHNTRLTIMLSLVDKTAP